MKSKGEDDEEERMEDHSGNCSVSLHSLDGSSIRTIRQSRQGKRHSKPLQELNLLGRMTGMNQRKFQQGLSMDRRLILRS